MSQYGAYQLARDQGWSAEQILEYFYPGAKVDPRAYVPNLTPLAAAGYPVVVLKLPYNIAFFSPKECPCRRRFAPC